MRTYRLTDTHKDSRKAVVSMVVESESPLLAVMQYAEDNLTPVELAYFAGSAYGELAVLNTTNHEIVAELAMESVAA